MPRMAQRLFNRARGLVSGGGSSPYLAARFPEYSIGEKSYGDLHVRKYNSSNTLTIGNYCSFARDVQVFLGGEHRPDWITTYPFNVLDSNFSDIKGHPHSKGNVVIGSDVWIGRGAVILSGVRVGDGAVIGAYSLVAKDVPDYAIFGGNPARLIRMRFSDGVIEKLLEIGWWRWPADRVARAVPWLQSEKIGDFIKLVEEGSL